MPIDELRRYSTDHFPASTCVVYVAHPFLGGIDALAAEAPTRRSLIRFDLFQQQHEQLKVTPRFPTNPPQTYLKHVLQQYGLLASDGIHLSGTGNEALAMLYQYAVLGSTPGIGKTTFSPVVRYPNATVPDWSAYVSRTCS